jgi:TPR repeat protein
MTKIIISIFSLLTLNLSADVVVNNGMVEFVEAKSIPVSELYAKACENGNMNRCVDLGVLYFTGGDVEEDHEKAEKLFAMACKNKNSKACYHLGTIYKRGSKYMNGRNGIEKNLKKSKMFYARGCMCGYAQSCVQYNLIKEKGESRDLDIDTRLYRYDTQAYGG